MLSHNIGFLKKPTPESKRLPPPDVYDAQVVKRQKGGRVVQGTTQIIFGAGDAVQAR